MASRPDKRHDNAATELLRRSLARDTAAAGECSEPEILAAYFERSLNAEETARCELHLSGCARCREELALLRRADEHVTIGGEIPRLRERRATLWDWRWLAPAAAVLVLATIWIARRPANPKSESQAQPLVAMSQPSEPAAKEAPAPSRAPAHGPSSAAAPSPEMAQNRALDKAQNGMSRELAEPLTNKKHSQVAPLDDLRNADTNRSAKSPGGSQSDSEKSATPTETESNEIAGALQTAPTSPGAAAPPAPSANATGIAKTETDATAQAQALKSPRMAASAKPNLYAKKDEKAGAADEIAAAARVVRTSDPKVLWQIPEQGLLKSEDGGATWRPVDLPVANARVIGTAAASAQVCWVVGRDSLILLTADGTHWQTVAPPVQSDFAQVFAQNASSATVTTADGLRFQTSDAGKHWHAIP